MAGMGWIGALRSAGLGLLAAFAAGCASTPAPIASWPTASRAPELPEPGGTPRIVDEAASLQCVPFARTVSGIEIYGDANTWWDRAAGRYPRSSTPAPGSVLVLRGYRSDARGHVAVVTEIVSERVIRVDQANWFNRGEVSRDVPVLDVSPANDWSEVRVWYIPDAHWGGRVYQAHGFIHPFLLQAMT